MPFFDDLYAGRNIDFAPSIHADYEGEAPVLDGASASIQVRQYPGADDPVLAQHIGFEFTDQEHETLPGWRTLSLYPVLARETLDAFPGKNQPEAGDSQTFYYEVKMTYGDGAQDSLGIGKLFLAPGVNTI